MTIFLFANNATTTLAGAISATATTINLAAGTGALFPSPASGQVFTLTLVDASTGLKNEICYCTARSSDALTVTRGQEGTQAQAWVAGDLAANFLTAAAIKSLAPLDSPNFINQITATYGSGNALSYKLQTDGNAVWYTGTTVLFAIGAGGAYTNQPFTAYANINAKYDIVGNGSIGVGGGFSQGGPSNNNFQWTGDLTSGFNPAYSKTNGVYLASVLNAYAVSGACAYLGTGVNGGPIVLFTGNGQQGIIGSISTNSGQTGVLFNTTSDRRLKTDIAPVAAADAIARLQKLKPSSFVMTADPNQAVVTGFIADEFAEVYPQGTTGQADATTTNDRGEALIVPQQIDKTFTLPDAISVIQYLLTEVEALKADAASATKAS